MAPPATSTRDPSWATVQLRPWPLPSGPISWCWRNGFPSRQLGYKVRSQPGLRLPKHIKTRQWTNSGESMENRVTNRPFIPIIHYHSLSYPFISYHSIISSLSQSLMLSWTWRLNTALGFATGSAWWLQAQILSDRLPSSKIWKLSHSWFEGRLWNYSHRAWQNQSHNHP